LDASRVGVGLLIAGLVVLVASFLISLISPEGSRRFWMAYLQNYAFFLSLSLGGLFFVVLQHLTRAGWSVVVRRPAEVMAMNLSLLAVLFVPVAVVVASGKGIIYPWAQPAAVFEKAAHAGDSHGSDSAHDAAAATTAGEHGHVKSGRLEGHSAHLVLEKRAYLNTPFFIIRCVFYFAVWVGLARWFWQRSVRQDHSADAALTTSMQTVAAPAMLAFALTATFASFDLLMSLDPVWFSTIYGVYFFAGSAVGFFAALILVILLLQKRGLLTSSINAEHYHDLGKFLFGFVFFWGYIAFSQYMLIWYGNIPEETGWFFRRGCATQAPNVWSYVILFLLFGHFVVPFVFLLNRDVKRRAGFLAFWAVWLLVLHWIDLYWLVMPEVTTGYLPLGVAEIGCLLGLGAIFVAGLAWWSRGRSLLPLGDPRLGESLAFRNL